MEMDPTDSITVAAAAAAINAASMRLCVGELVLHCASCRFHFYLPIAMDYIPVHTSTTDAKQSKAKQDLFSGLLNSYLDACMKKKRTLLEEIAEQGSSF